MMAKNQEEIISKLKQDIDLLREPKYGYIKAGLPRFPSFYGRDSCIMGWQLLDHDTNIARKTIEIFCRFQGKRINPASEEEPGKLLHQWQPEPISFKFMPRPLPYYGSVDVTPLFIYLCYLYYEKTTDTEWLASVWPHISKALEWCEKYGDIDDDLLIEYERKTVTGLTHQGWKDSLLNHLNIKRPVELAEVQGYYYAALLAGAEFALMLKNEELSQKLLTRASRLKEYFVSQFWLQEERYFAFALEESRTPVSRITSNPGHLLFTGILDDKKEKREAIAERLFKEDMWTPYGIRTHSAQNPDFNPMSYHLGSVWPHDNWIIAQGLKRYDYKEEYQMIKDALLAAYHALGKIPELYAVIDSGIKEIPIACHPQAWSSAGLLNFLLEKPI